MKRKNSLQSAHIETTAGVYNRDEEQYLSNGKGFGLGNEFGDGQTDHMPHRYVE